MKKFLWIKRFSGNNEQKDAVAVSFEIQQVVLYSWGSRPLQSKLNNMVHQKLTVLKNKT
jgi:hypothetical protein